MAVGGGFFGVVFLVLNSPWLILARTVLGQLSNGGMKSFTFSILGIGLMYITDA